MLPAKERLTRSGLFQKAYTARKSIASPVATLYVLPRTRQAPGQRGGSATGKHSGNCAEMPLPDKTMAKMPLVGFVIAKKVCKSACARNRAKRRIREAYRSLRRSAAYYELSLDYWYALVLVIHEKALDAGWNELEATLNELLTKAKARFGAQKKNLSSAPVKGQKEDRRGT